MRLYIARHVETTWNLAGRYQGRRESAMSARGVQQGLAIGEAFTRVQPRVERIVSSPLLRTRATAQFVANRLGLTVENDDGLLEIEHGTWNGRMRDEIARNEPDLFRAWRERPAEVAFNEGETLAGVLARWRAFRARFEVNVPTLVVTHDAVIRVALCDVMERPLSEFWQTNVENAAYAEVDVDGPRWTIVNERVNAHLADLRASIEGQAL
jgi:probable phosphoglycerate mutase